MFPNVIERCERGGIIAMRAERIIELLPARHSGAPDAPGKWPVVFEGREIGCWKDPECTSSRWLLDIAKAERSDRLVTTRNGVRCMTGLVGWFADHRVVETDKRSPHFAVWKPFDGAAKNAARRVTVFDSAANDGEGEYRVGDDAQGAAK